MTQSKLLGSTLIIAGTTIGAGMLALPLASAGIGFSTSLMIMLGLWMLMAFTALLMVEIHQYADKEATLHTLAKQILGDKGKWVATFAMLFCFTRCVRPTLLAAAHNLPNELPISLA